MKAAARPSGNSNSAFTLVEVMFTVLVFSLILVALISTQLIGMRTYTLSATKLKASSDARKVINWIRDQIREAQDLYIGNYIGAVNFTNFPTIANSTNQQGNALEIFPTTNSTPYYIYFQDSSANQLKVYDSGDGSVQTLANNVTNSSVFMATDYRGNILTNNQNNRLITVTLQFYQWGYLNGTNSVRGFYQLRTQAARRSIQ